MQLSTLHHHFKSTFGTKTNTMMMMMMNKILSDHFQRSIQGRYIQHYITSVSNMSIGLVEVNLRDHSTKGHKLNKNW